MRSQYPLRCATFLALAPLFLVAACGDNGGKQTAGTPAREIQLAPSAPAQPQLNDAPVAAAPAPNRAPAPKQGSVAKARAPEKAAEPEVVVRPLSVQDNPGAPAAAPAPAAVAPASDAPVSGTPTGPAMGTVSAGRAFAVHPIARVCTNTFKVGDRFTALLSETIVGTDGAVIPSGSSVVLKVDESTRSENSKDSLRLTFSVVSLRIGQQSYDLTGHVSQTTPLEKVRVQTTGDQAKKVGAGAVIGALAGQLLGHNTRSTVIGGAVGAAAGAAVAAGTSDYDGCVPANANLTVNLDAPLHVRVLPD